MKVFIKQSKDDILHNKIWKCLLNKVRMIYYITKYDILIYYITKYESVF